MDHNLIDRSRHGDLLRLLEEANGKLDRIAMTTDGHTESLQRIETHVASFDTLFKHFVLNTHNDRGVRLTWIIALAGVVGVLATLLLM